MELRKHHPGLVSRNYGAQIVDLTRKIQTTWNTQAERYRNLGDPVLMFGTSTHTTRNRKFYDQRDLTHQYQNHANETSQISYIEL